MSDVFNYHGLFFNPTSSAFLSKLDLDSETENSLLEAVKAIKDRLKPVLQALAEKEGIQKPYSIPQFRPQGSSVYKTQNAPAHIPQQQVDVDLGTYISATFFEIVGSQNERRQLPAAALAKAYFETVDKELRDLCREKGWRYAEGKKQNDKCCRVDLSPLGVHAHIDVPLYAAPNSEFELAVESFAEAARSVVFAKAQHDHSSDLDEDGWDELKVVVMATRQGQWLESDVQKTIIHFRRCADASGHPFIIRRAWRYVKAWRDFNWKSGGGPSSILLMECVARIVTDYSYRNEDILTAGRDDLMLRKIFALLPGKLGSSVWVSWGSRTEDLNSGDDSARQLWSQDAKTVAGYLERAATEEDLSFDQVISLVRTAFGQRIPSDVTLIKWMRTSTSPAYGLGAALTHQSPQSRIHRTSGA